MKKQLFTLFASITCASLYAAPGFLYAKFTGSNYDGDSDIWSNATSVVLSPSMLYASSSYSGNTYTTFAYGTYMYMEGGVVYNFRAAWDDHASVKIDDNYIIPQTGGCCAGYGSIKFVESGWHKLELRVSNISGPYGSISSIAFYGIHYSTDGKQTWNSFVDSGDGSKFKTEIPSDYVIPAEIDMGRAGFRMVKFSGSAYDGSSSIWDNDSQVCCVYP